MIRNILIEEVKKTLPDEECAVLLSGGVDSVSVALAADILGKKLSCYSFHLSGNPSYDYITAEKVCNTMEWDFVGIEVPTENIQLDFHTLVNLGCKKKTHYECVFPFLYVYPKIKEKYVLSGWGADGYYGLSRSALDNTKKWRVKENKKNFDAFRRDYYLDDNCAGYNHHKIVAEKYDKVFVTPYLCKEVSDFFFALDWYEVNRPKQKHHIRSAFADGFSKLVHINQHLNLQLGAGIPALFDVLLDDDEINYRNRKRMLDVYRDWNRGSLQSFL